MSQDLQEKIDNCTKEINRIRIRNIIRTKQIEIKYLRSITIQRYNLIDEKNYITESQTKIDSLTQQNYRLEQRIEVLICLKMNYLNEILDLFEIEQQNKVFSTELR